jgi:hypothetical protein
VAGHQLVRSLGVLVLEKPFGQHVLFLRLQHREPADLGEVAVETILTRGNSWQTCLGHNSTPSPDYSAS